MSDRSIGWLDILKQIISKSSEIPLQKMQGSDGTKSLFAMTHAKSATASSVNKVNPNHFGDESSIVKDNEAKSIHDENVQLLSGMNEAEILAERQELLETIGELFPSELYS